MRSRHPHCAFLGSSNVLIIGPVQEKEFDVTGFLGVRRERWIWQVTVLSVVLGMLLAAALKTQQNVKRVSGIPTTRFSGLAQLLLDEKDRNRLLQKEVREQRAKVDAYERAIGQGGTETEILKKELEKYKLLAGLLPAEGPGVEVTLRDYPKEIPSNSKPELNQEYIIHDYDLRVFVNELLASGAEAIAITDADSTQRIIANTPIRCDAGVIRVNRVPMASPFTITAIGPPNALKSTLEMNNGAIVQFRFIEGLADSMIKVKTAKRLVIPAYSGSTSFLYATPVTSEASK